MYEELSTEHIENIRKILDEMSFNMARIHGGMETLRLLYPYFGNEPDMMRASQALGQIRTVPSLQLVTFFRVLSEQIGKELETRGKRNAL